MTADDNANDHIPRVRALRLAATVFAQMLYRGGEFDSESGIMPNDPLYATLPDGIDGNATQAELWAVRVITGRPVLPQRNNTAAAARVSLRLWAISGRPMVAVLDGAVSA